MDFVSRLKYFMENSNLAISQFADSCRIPRPTMSQILNGRNKKVSDELIAKIHTAYPQLSILWLMFGEGSMTINENNQFSERIKGHNSNITASQTTDNDTNTDFAQSDFSSNENKQDNSSQKSASGFNRIFTNSDDNQDNQHQSFDDKRQSLIDFSPNANDIDTRPDSQCDFAANGQWNTPNHNQEKGVRYTSQTTIDESIDSFLAQKPQPNNSMSASETETNDTHQGELNYSRNISLKTNANKRITNIVVFYSDNSFQSFIPSS